MRFDVRRDEAGGAVLLSSDSSAWKAGLKFGRKIGHGFVPNPDRSIHAASAKYIRERDALHPTLDMKVQAQREFKGGAYRGYKESIER